jgi:hypothetical protein
MVGLSQNKLLQNRVWFGEASPSMKAGSLNAGALGNKITVARDQRFATEQRMAQSPDLKPKTELKKQLQADNPMMEMVTRLLGLLKEAKRKWHLEPNSPEVPPRVVTIDPKMIRPDGTNQPYGYYFYPGGVNSDGTEKEGYITMKGLLQPDRHGHPVTRSEMGEEAFQAIQKSAAENTVPCKQ